MKTKKVFLVIMFIPLIAFVSCKKEKEDEDISKTSKYANGVFVVNQGTMGKSNGDISFLNLTDKSVSNGLFQTTNQRPAGDVIQSIASHSDKYYIVVNISGKVEITDSDFKQMGVINDLNQPRYLIGINSAKAYVSEWGADGMSGAIAVVDLNTSSITKRIALGSGSENMLLVGNNLYVANSGGYGVDSTVMVIDISTDMVIDTIKTGYNPNSMVLDKNGKLWVLCGGKSNPVTWSLEVQPSLCRVDVTSGTVETSMSTTGVFSVASGLCINKEKDKLFFSLSYLPGIFAVSIDASSIEASVINQSAYGLAVDNKTNLIYCANPGDYTVSGWVYRYNTDYTLLDSFNVGMAPSGFLFQ